MIPRLRQEKVSGKGRQYGGGSGTHRGEKNPLWRIARVGTRISAGEIGGLTPLRQQKRAKTGHGSVMAGQAERRPGIMRRL
jgi:hypothetical protein